MLVLLEEAAGDVPAALVRLVRAPPEQEPAAVVLEERGGRRRRVRVRDEAAGGAVDAAVGVRELRAAPRTDPPPVENRHNLVTLPRSEMTEHPEPSEQEEELADTERHQDEEAMRGAEHHDPPRRGSGLPLSHLRGTGRRTCDEPRLQLAAAALRPA